MTIHYVLDGFAEPFVRGSLPIQAAVDLALRPVGMFFGHLGSVGGKVEVDPDYPKAQGCVEVILDAGASRRAEVTLSVVRTSLGMIGVRAKAKVSHGIVDYDFFTEGLHFVVPK